MLSFIKQPDEPEPTRILENPNSLEKKPFLAFFIEILKDENLSLDSKHQKYFERIFIELIKYSDIGYTFNEYSFDRDCILNEEEIENIRKLVNSIHFNDIYNSILNDNNELNDYRDFSETIEKLKKGESFSVIFEKFITLRRINKLTKNQNLFKSGLSFTNINGKSYTKLGDINYEVLKILGSIIIIKSLNDGKISFVNSIEKKLLFSGKSFDTLDLDSYNDSFYGMFVVGDGKNSLLIDTINDRIIGDNLFDSIGGITNFTFLLDNGFLSLNNNYIIPILVPGTVNKYYFYEYNFDSGNLMKGYYLGETYLDPLEESEGNFFTTEYIDGVYRAKNLTTGDYYPCNETLKYVDTALRLDYVEGVLVYAENIDGRKGLFNLTTGEFKVYDAIDIDVEENTFTYKPEGVLDERVEV